MTLTGLIEKHSPPKRKDSGNIKNGTEGSTMINKAGNSIAQHSIVRTFLLSKISDSFPIGHCRRNPPAIVTLITNDTDRNFSWAKIGTKEYIVLMIYPDIIQLITPKGDIRKRLLRLIGSAFSSSGAGVRVIVRGSIDSEHSSAATTKGIDVMMSTMSMIYWLAPCEVYSVIIYIDNITPLVLRELLDSSQLSTTTNIVAMVNPAQNLMASHVTGNENIPWTRYVDMLRHAKAAKARMCPTRRMILSLFSAPNMNPA